MKLASTVYSPGATSAVIVYVPVLFVSPPAPVPVSEICAPCTGAAPLASTTRPVIVYACCAMTGPPNSITPSARSEEHTSELQSHRDLHSFPTRRSSDLRSLHRCGAAGVHYATGYRIRLLRDDRAAQQHYSER